MSTTFQQEKIVMWELITPGRNTQWHELWVESGAVRVPMFMEQVEEEMSVEKPEKNDQKPLPGKEGGISATSNEVDRTCIKLSLHN